MEENKDTNSPRSEGIVIKKKHIVIAAVLAVLILAGGVLVGMNWNNMFGNKNDDTAQTSAQTSDQTQASKPEASVDLDPNAGTYTGSKPVDKGGAAKGIKIPGYPSITIDKDTTDVTMALMNPEGNPCYFKFVIALKDTDETIFESKYVKPGDAISDVKLTKPLTEGEHPAIIKITTLSLDGKTALNGANVETVLIAR